jgi:hypothetical protein
MPDTPYSPKGPARASQPGRWAGHDSRSDERRRDAAAIARLKAELAAQAALIASQELSLAHSRKIFDRASVAAPRRVGMQPAWRAAGMDRCGL